MNVMVTARRLQSFLAKLETVEYSPFVFEGVKYQIIWLTPEEADAGEEAWFEASTAIEGFDIYLSEEFSEDEIQRVLFHEILESQLLQYGALPPLAHTRALHAEQAVFGLRPA